MHNIQAMLTQTIVACMLVVALLQMAENNNRQQQEERMEAERTHQRLFVTFNTHYAGRCTLIDVQGPDAEFVFIADDSELTFIPWLHRRRQGTMPVTELTSDMRTTSFTCHAAKDATLRRLLLYTPNIYPITYANTSDTNETLHQANVAAMIVYIRQCTCIVYMIVHPLIGIIALIHAIRAFRKPVSAPAAHVPAHQRSEVESTPPIVTEGPSDFLFPTDNTRQRFPDTPGLSGLPVSGMGCFVPTNDNAEHNDDDLHDA